MKVLIYKLRIETHNNTFAKNADTHENSNIFRAVFAGCPEAPDIIQKLNRMPMGAIEYKYAIDAFRELYEIREFQVISNVIASK